MANVFKSLYRKFQYRFVKRHQHHIVYTDLDPGFQEIDVVMLHAMFALLCRYVEEEHGGPEQLQLLIDQVETELPHQWVADSEALELYMWWKNDYPKLREVDYLYNTPVFKQKMHQLVDISGTLWT